MAKPRAPKKTTIDAARKPATGAPEITNAAVPTESASAAASTQQTAIEAATPRSNAKKTATEPAATKSLLGRPTIIKSESRANLVPINLEEEIRKLAYLMAERRGFEPGHEAEDWLAAEREVQQRYHQQSA